MAITKRVGIMACATGDNSSRKFTIDLVGRSVLVSRVLSNATSIDDWTGVLLEPLAQLNQLRLIS